MSNLGTFYPIFYSIFLILPVILPLLTKIPVRGSYRIKKIVTHEISFCRIVFKTVEVNIPLSLSRSDFDPLFLYMVEIFLSLKSSGILTSFLILFIIIVMDLTRSRPATGGLISHSPAQGDRNISLFQRTENIKNFFFRPVLRCFC